MKQNIRVLVVLFLVASFLNACGASQADQDVAATQAAADSFAKQTASAPTDTATPQPSDTATPLPSSTPVPSATPNLSQTAAVITRDAFLAQSTATAAVALSTQQAEDGIWTLLVSDGAVTYNQGKLTKIDDFEESWAQRLWYRWWRFDMSLSDLVILTHVEWEYPKDANLGAGGCGFVLRVKDNEHHIYTGVDADRRVFLGLMTPNGAALQTRHWMDPSLSAFPSSSPPTRGSADFWLVAEKDLITAYIDGKMITQWYVAATNTGDIGYTVLSGTNNEPGTYCKFTNTRIWELVK